MTADLRDLLDLLGRDDDERVTICHDDGGRFDVEWTTVGKAHVVAERFAGQDCWFSAQPLHPRVVTGRGTARDVVGLRDLYADLDVKDGGLSRYNEAWLVIG